MQYASPEISAMYMGFRRLAFPDKWQESQSKFYRTHRDEVNRKCREYYAKNSESIREQKKKYRAQNRAKKQAQWKARYQSEPIFRMRHALGIRVRTALRSTGRRKCTKTMELVGCDVPFLKKHLEARFTPAMSWDNYGKIWHLDHILPCASFDLTSPSEQKICFHFSNLQPLLAFDNISKSNRVL